MTKTLGVSFIWNNIHIHCHMPTHELLKHSILHLFQRINILASLLIYFYTQHSLLRPTLSSAPTWRSFCGWDRSLPLVCRVLAATGHPLCPRCALLERLQDLVSWCLPLWMTNGCSKVIQSNSWTQGLIPVAPHIYRLAWGALWTAHRCVNWPWCGRAPLGKSGLWMLGIECGVTSYALVLSDTVMTSRTPPCSSLPPPLLLKQGFSV